MRSGILGLALFVGGITIGAAHAQIPGVAQELIARGQAPYAAEVDGAADVIIGSIVMSPGSRYGEWHTHPGPVWLVVKSGELAVYGPDGCRSLQQAGSAFATEPDAAYDLRNEGAAPVEFVFAGIVPAGENPTVPTSDPGLVCSR
jgi:hypothetical protein